MSVALSVAFLLAVIVGSTLLCAVWLFGGWRAYGRLWRGLLTDAWHFWTRQPL